MAAIKHSEANFEIWQKWEVKVGRVFAAGGLLGNYIYQIY